MKHQAAQFHAFLISIRDGSGWSRIPIEEVGPRAGMDILERENLLYLPAI
jgi:hypothetical protein